MKQFLNTVDESFIGNDWSVYFKRSWLTHQAIYRRLVAVAEC